MIAAILIGVLATSTVTDSAEPPLFCESTKSFRCVCSNGRPGRQTCAVDGRSFEPCRCPENAGVSEHENDIDVGTTSDRLPSGRGAGFVVASGILPGLGQLFEGETVFGVLHMAIGITSGAALIGFSVALTGLAFASTSLYSNPRTVLDSRQTEVMLARRLSDVWYAIFLTHPVAGLLAAVAAGNWVWSFFDANPPSSWKE